MRDKFLSRYDNKSTIANYHKSFKKLDQFLQETNQTEQNFIEKLNVSELHTRYNLLQELIDSIKKTVSEPVTRNYFDNLFMYFLLEGVPLDYTQKKLRLRFPRVRSKVFEGLDRERIEIIFSKSKSLNFVNYMKCLCGGGFRETEGLLVTPRMIKFDKYPVLASLPAEITKYSIERETFLPPNIAASIQQQIIVNGIKPNENIFVTNYTDNTLKDFEEYFAALRTKAGLDTPDRKKHQQNDITLHSLRAFFITTFTDHGQEAFGRALAGHTKYRNVYYRKSPNQRITIYSSIMNDLDF